MGYGDKLMAIGDAWAQHQADPLHRKVAIGTGEVVDQSNIDLTWGLSDFLATPDEVLSGDVSWVISYPGCRPYIDYPAIERACQARGIYLHKKKKMVAKLGRYIWRADYRPKPALIRLTPEEEDIVERWKSKGPFVVLEPFIKASAPPSKQYPVERFQEIGRRLQRELPVYQIGSPDSRPLVGFPQIRGKDFRQAIAYLKAAALYIGPEGGLHHAAAAVGTPAVVTFGGFIGPQTTGYPDVHVNLTGGAVDACGTRYGACPHCTKAFSNITPALVLAHAKRLLAGEHP